MVQKPLNRYKGIVLSGGKGSRLWPNTKVTSKQLLPVYSKPLIYYPICTLMLAGIRDIILVSTPGDLTRFQNLLADGSQWGINIEYVVQYEPKGIAECFILCEEHIRGYNTALVLGDNIYHGHDFAHILKESADLNDEGATVFALPVADPERFGVVEFDANDRAISIEEKPKNPKSNFAVTGLYFYDDQVLDIAKSLKPSERGELEITDVNKVYLAKGQLLVKVLGRGYSWFDTGTFDTMLEASNFISGIEKRHGMMVSCPEEIAFRNGWITKEQLAMYAEVTGSSDYGKYLKQLCEGKILP